MSRVAEVKRTPVEYRRNLTVEFENRVGAEFTVNHGWLVAKERNILERTFPAAQQCRWNFTGGGNFIEFVYKLLDQLRGRKLWQTCCANRLGIEGVNGGDRRPDAAGQWARCSDAGRVNRVSVEELEQNHTCTASILGLTELTGDFEWQL